MRGVCTGSLTFWIYVVSSNFFKAVANNSFALRIPLTQQHRRHLNFIPGSAAAESARVTLLAPGASQMLTAGNITLEVSASSTFSARYAYGPAINGSISGLNYLSSRTFQNASCASVEMKASGGLNTYIFTTQAFLDWQAAFNMNMSVDSTIAQVPSVAEGSTYRNVSETNYTVPVDSSQGYLLVLANPNNVTVNVTYQYAGLASTSAECSALQSRAGLSPSPLNEQDNATSASETVFTVLYGGISPSSVRPVGAVTNASCISFGLTSGLGPGADNHINVTSNILSTPPEPPFDLNMSLFLVDEAGQAAFGSRAFTNFQDSAIGSYCYITHAKPGFSSTYVDGLKTSAIYTVWLLQGSGAINSTFWQYNVISAQNSGSCQDIFPQANRVEIGAPVQAKSSQSGKIIGGIIGGIAGIVILAGLFYIIGKRRWQRSHSPQSKNPFALYTSGNNSEVETSMYTDFDGAVKLVSQDITSDSTTITSPAPFSSAAELSEFDNDFEMEGAMLPSLGDGSQGGNILGISKEAEANLRPQTNIDDARLENTWKINSQDIMCKVKDKKPVILGKGGFGKVYAGLLNNVREVAIKVVSSQSEEQQKRFIREIMLLKACMDPNIVQFLGACIRNQQTLMVMEYLPMGDLYSCLNKDDGAAFGWYSRGRKIAIGITKGLVFLHSKKIAHLDMKSPNVLLTETYEAKIADVGLGKIVSEANNKTATQEGSFMWASPEQLQLGYSGLPSDIFSLGTILWEICTMEKPIGRRTRSLEVPSEAPANIAKIIEQCHSLDPLLRPTAVEVHTVLQASKSSRP